ncbi:hypothetical protein PFICI_14892 [Pestalotiopsis fici W106-1]|uniref:Zn(2)-C6 fungal-type domain-containing protein n=1 Tax=Pestalotiopsis fici (strain W106-1 / CGMCC3.15140) TaxID=1229662 RepID=W3WJI1_PESFW|nr:uncharacterized protein PFICI_14892 [Pestalotiopsis fici W106-1]ETS73287.1 hypothetical protein PFICI_14892 [Pestalotiopsis fici W106-1]
MPISRRKSCFECRAAKARCSRDPNCFRCVERGLNCDYMLPRPTPYSRPADDTPPQTGYIRPGNVDQATVSNEVPLPAGNPTSSFDVDPELPLEQWPSSGWLRDSPLGSELGDLWQEAPTPLMPMGDSSQRITSQLLEMINEDQPDSRFACFKDLDQQQPSPFAQMVNTQLDESSFGRNHVFSILGNKCRTVSGTQFDMLAKPKRAITSSSFLTTQVLLSQVREYPSMLLSERLPPFIYPDCVLNGQRTDACIENGMHVCLPKPLAICATVVQLSSSRNRQNSSFVTKIILEEQGRLMDGVESFDTAALLAATQASMIYVLLQAQRASSASRDELKFMISCLVDLLSRLHESSIYQSDIYSIKPLNEREWALLESVRRLAGLLFVIEIVLGVVFGRTDTANCPGFANIPLPCPKNLWDYESKTSWPYRVSRYTKSRSSGSHPTISDLVAASNSSADLQTIPLENQTFGKVVEWCQALDDLGTLVWMAVLLDN